MTILLVGTFLISNSRHRTLNIVTILPVLDILAVWKVFALR